MGVSAGRRAGGRPSGRAFAGSAAGGILRAEGGRQTFPQPSGRLTVGLGPVWAAWRSLQCVQCCVLTPCSGTSGQAMQGSVPAGQVLHLPAHLCIFVPCD